MKEEWKYVLMDSGEQCVIIIGVLLMQTLHVASWATLMQVCHYLLQLYISYDSDYLGS